MSTTGPHANDRAAFILARALERTGRVASAEVVENGCAVHARTGSVALTVWLPDGPYGYAWETRRGVRNLPGYAGIDQVVLAVGADLSLEEVRR